MIVIASMFFLPALVVSALVRLAHEPVARHATCSTRGISGVGVLAEDPFEFGDDVADCADEGQVLNGPAMLLRALLDAEPSPSDFSSALWRGLVPGGLLYHRADALTRLPPEPS